MYYIIILDISFIVSIQTHLVLLTVHFNFIFIFISTKWLILQWDTLLMTFCWCYLSFRCLTITSSKNSQRLLRYYCNDSLRVLLRQHYVRWYFSDVKKCWDFKTPLTPLMFRTGIMRCCSFLFFTHNQLIKIRHP